MSGEATNYNHDVEVRLLGSLELRVDGAIVPVNAPQQRVVLAQLALAVGRPVSADRLTDAVWGDNAPATARTALHNAIRRLRSSLIKVGAGEVIETTPEGYRLAVAPAQVDVTRFKTLIQQARNQATNHQRARATDSYEQAFELWGEPLAGLPIDGAISADLEQLIDLEVTATEEWADLQLAAGAPELVLERLVPLVEQWPVRESLHACHMLALHRAGRTADALAAYTRARDHLISELGIEPGQAMREAHQRILRLDERTPVEPRLPLVVPAQLPAVPAPVVGRGREFALLDDALGHAQSYGDLVTVVVSGPAGVGKSTLAVQWARQVAQNFPDGQLFVNLRGFDPHGSPLGPIEALRGVLTALGVSDDDVPNDLGAATGLYRSLLSGRRVLMVLDNARDATQVRHLLPTTDGCLALVTSRHELPSLAVTDGAQRVSLNLLSREESEALLADRLGAVRLIEEPDALAEIVTRCGGLPLALAVAAARVKGRDDLPLASFAEELRAVGSLEALHLDDPIADVRTVLSWSVQALSDESTRVFRLLGLHPGPEASIASIISSAALPARPARAAVADLIRAHLAIQRTGGRMAFHDLIREQARELVEESESEPVRQQATIRLVQHYLHSAFAATRAMFSSPLPFALDAPEPGVIPETFAGAEEASAWLAAEQLVLVRIVELAARTPGLEVHAWRLARTLNGYLWDRCQCPDMARMHEAALAATLHTGDVQGQADARHGLGEAAIGLEEYDAGRDQLTQAIDLFIACGDRTGESDARCTLGRLLEAAGEYPDAIDHTMQALAIYEEIGDRTGQAVALNNIGWLHACLGNFAESLGSCQRSLELYRAEGDLPGQTYALDSLGRAHQGLGNQLLAIACFAEAAELASGLAQHFNRAQNLSHLGDGYAAIGDLDAARSAWRSALAILEMLEHANAHDVRQRLAALGQVGVPAPADTTSR